MAAIVVFLIVVRIVENRRLSRLEKLAEEV